MSTDEKEEAGPSASVWSTILALLFWGGIFGWSFLGQNEHASDKPATAAPGERAPVSRRTEPTPPRYGARPAAPKHSSPPKVLVSTPDQSTLVVPKPEHEPPPPKLHRLNANKCGVEFKSHLRKLIYDKKSGLAGTRAFTQHQYNASDANGSHLSVSCWAAKPRLGPQEVLAALVDGRRRVVDFEGSALLSEREIDLDGQPAMEINTREAGMFYRWHHFSVGGVLHTHVAAASDAAALDTLLGGVKLTRTAGRVRVRAQQSDYSSPSASPRRRGASSLPSVKGNGEVQVRGYHRKDGTFVRPHTRSRPKR